MGPSTHFLHTCLRYTLKAYILPTCSCRLSSYGRVSMFQVKHNKRMGIEGLFFYHPNLLCCLDQTLAAIELSQYLILQSKTVRPIIPRGAWYVGHVKIMWSAVCSLAPHLHFYWRSKTPFVHGRTKTPNASTQAIEFDSSCSGQTLSNGSCADPRNVDIECWHTFGVLCVPCQVCPLGSADAQLR